MSSKIKNIILFTIVAAVLILGYIFFLKPSGDEKNLVSSNPQIDTVNNNNNNNNYNTDVLDKNFSLTQDFLTVLLNVKNIKLDDSVFSSNAFSNLRDSSISLVPAQDEGRPNPFAPIGVDLEETNKTLEVQKKEDTSTILPIVENTDINNTCILPQILDTETNTCVLPEVKCELPEVLNTATNTCFTPVKCKAPKVLNTATNTCFTPVKCKAPKVLDITTNSCITPEKTL